MKWFWSKRDKLPPHTQIISGNSKAKEVLANLDTLQQIAARHKKESQDIHEQLRRTSEEYDNLYSIHKDLLRKAGESLLICEILLQKSLINAQEAIKSMENTLKEQGVERFSPNIGDPLGGCRVEGDLAVDTLGPGLIAEVLMPGFRFKEGEIIVAPRVLKSVEHRVVRAAQVEPYDTKDIKNQSAERS